MKIKYLIIFTLFLSAGFLTSCEDEDIEVDTASTYPISGDWSVTYSVENSAGEMEDALGHPAELLIYNTAADNGEQVWVDDHGNFWDFKVKTPINIQNLTFGGENLENVSYESQVTISNGKVIRNATRANGIQVDSIYFEVSFDDDDAPGTVYHVAGHRATGFEDDH